MARRRIADPSRLSPFQKFYLSAVAAIVLGPFLPLIVQSFSFQWDWPHLLPTTWWWTSRETSFLPQGWDYVLSPYSRVWEATLNTVFIGVVVMALCLIDLPAGGAGAGTGKASEASPGSNSS